MVRFPALVRVGNWGDELGNAPIQSCNGGSRKPIPKFDGPHKKPDLLLCVLLDRGIKTPCLDPHPTIE